MEYWYKYRDDLWKCVTVHDVPEDKRGGCTHVHPDKTPDNIRRAARMIEAYALCNEWQWFGSFTLNPEYKDRTDLDGFRRDLMQLVRNTRRDYGTDTAALLVPELHRDKNGWHMHGLLNGLPLEALRPFTLRERPAKHIRMQLCKGVQVYDWPRYRERFGFVDLEPVRNRDAAARYITKYITKGWDSSAMAIDKGKHLYYVTKGLKLPERMENAPGCLPEAFPAEALVTGNSYEYDYGTVQWYSRRS